MIKYFNCKDWLYLSLLRNHVSSVFNTDMAIPQSLYLSITKWVAFRNISHSLPPATAFTSLIVRYILWYAIWYIFEYIMDMFIYNIGEIWHNLTHQTFIIYYQYILSAVNKGLFDVQFGEL